ncbi:Flp pilus assembly protein CpaB [Collinsella aerofaciens]|uniref:Flp pilus assembly protein CpaB n=1 Tax=Collinsella aerofaciens TaxID=74426 RepID=UPI003D78F7EA
MFNKKDKDPAELPLDGEENKKRGFTLFGGKKDKDPSSKIVTPEKRRRQLSWLCGACAAVAVGSLAFAAVEFTVAQDTVAKSQADMIEIVVPKETIKAGTPITADMLEETQVPKRYVPSDAADTSSKSDLIGKAPVGNLTKGVPISMSTVQGSSNPSSISLALASGHVARTFSLDAAASMSPLLKPGDYVTVTATFKAGNGSTQQTVAYQNVKVLATDATLQSSDGSSQSAGYSTVTLELTPEQLSEIGSADSISLAAQPLSENPKDDSDSDALDAHSDNAPDAKDAEADAAAASEE